MNRRAFVPALAAAGLAPLVPPVASAGEAPQPPDLDAQRAPRRRPAGIMGHPRFERLSFEGKRLVEYVRPSLRKLPKPGPRALAGRLLSYDEMTASAQAELRQLLAYVEYMSEAELRRYLQADASGRVPRAALSARLDALAREPRIPYHTGSKLVITALGPPGEGAVRGEAVDPALMPHAGRELAAAGTWYTTVTDAAPTLAGWTGQILRGGAPSGAGRSPAAVLQARGVPRELLWAVLGQGAVSDRPPPEQAPYLLTTAEARKADAWLESRGIRKRMRTAKTPQEKRAVRQELRAIRAEAMATLGLAERYPSAEARRFIRHVLFGERGIKDRGNTFVHVGGLRAMQLVHPKFLYVQFGGPDAFLRAAKPGQTFGEQGALGTGNYTDADYLADVDQWAYYHWLEAQQHPHYAGAATVVLLFGPHPSGTTQAIVAGPHTSPGAHQRRPAPLRDLLRDAVAQIA